MTSTTTPCGRHIHWAANALRSVRTAALDANGVAFPQWAAMEVITENPGSNREQLIHELVELTVDDEACCAQAIDAVHQNGLITTGTDDSDALELTAQGETLAQQVISTRTELRDELYGGINADEMAITIGVLDTITQRAKAIQARRNN